MESLCSNTAFRFVFKGGKEWYNRYEFLTPSMSTCDWTGGSKDAIRCAFADRKVTDIGLPQNGMVGQIPTELGYLTGEKLSKEIYIAKKSNPLIMIFWLFLYTRLDEIVFVVKWTYGHNSFGTLPVDQFEKALPGPKSNARVSKDKPSWR